jgi:HPt (histidine-containing phosphotransfer) domain-containing protein
VPEEQSHALSTSAYSVPRTSDLLLLLLRLDSRTRSSKTTIADDPFHSLKQRFLGRCRADLLVMEAIAPEKLEAPGDAREQLTRMAHSLAGAGGTFGFASISESASDLEQLLVADIEPAAAEIEAALRTLVLELKRVTG